MFSTLPYADTLTSHLDTAPAARTAGGPENAVADASGLLLNVQQELGLPAPKPAVTQFWDRLYRYIDPAVPQPLSDGRRGPDLARLPAAIGSIEQEIDNAEVLARSSRRSAAVAAYRSWIDERA